MGNAVGLFRVREERIGRSQARERAALRAVTLFRVLTKDAVIPVVSLVLSGYWSRAPGQLQESRGKCEVVNRRRAMKTGMLLGIILIIFGAIALAYQGISYTTQKKVLDLGPIHATKEEHRTIPLPPIVGGVA